MNPKEYYYNNFTEHLHEWIKKSDFHSEKYLDILFLTDKLLSHIPKEELIYFYCSLSCTILIDQVMYSYFKEDYSKFEKMTLYPKMWHWLCIDNANPLSIIEHVNEYRLSWYKEIYGMEVEKFFTFFIKDLKDFFNEYDFIEATWENVKKEMKNDPQLSWGQSGEVFQYCLSKEN